MSFQPPPPTWVSEKDQWSGGQDFLALRNPAIRIGYVALNGMTSVTPRVRYLAFREWMLAVWWRTGGEDRVGAFTEFAQKVEAAIVLANLRAGVTTGGLIGSEKGADQLEAAEPWPLDALVKIPGATIYAGATSQLALDTNQFESGGQLEVHRVAGPSVGRGQDLAALVDAQMRTSTLGQMLAERRIPEKVDAELLDELAPHVRLDQIPESERAALVALLVPLEPHEDSSPALREEELRRIGSYTLLLELADRHGGIPQERHVFDVATKGGLELPEALQPVVDIWALFCIRDVLAMCHEASMRALTEALATVAVNGEATADAVLDELLSQGDVLNEALHSLGLLAEGERWDSLGAGDLHKRVVAQCSEGLWERSRLQRWQAGFTEVDVGAKALGGAAGPAPLVLIPVAWSLIAHRLASSADGGSHPHLELLDAMPFSVAQRVVPEVARWSADNPPLPGVLAQLAKETVASHLDTAWRRMQQNARSDAAHMYVEGETWRLRRPWREGAATARLNNACGWLQQLGLIDDMGLTAAGRALRDAALITLQAEVTP